MHLHLGRLTLLDPGPQVHVRTKNGVPSSTQRASGNSWHTTLWKWTASQRVLWSCSTFQKWTLFARLAPQFSRDSLPENSHHGVLSPEQTAISPFSLLAKVFRPAGVLTLSKIQAPHATRALGVETLKMAHVFFEAWFLQTLGMRNFVHLTFGKPPCPNDFQFISNHRIFFFCDNVSVSSSP